MPANSCDFWHFLPSPPSIFFFTAKTSRVLRKQSNNESHSSQHFGYPLRSGGGSFSPYLGLGSGFSQPSFTVHFMNGTRTKTLGPVVYLLPLAHLNSSCCFPECWGRGIPTWFTVALRRPRSYWPLPRNTGKYWLSCQRLYQKILKTGVCHGPAIPTSAANRN